jgi:GNAT superfamily N-acetyltransferase
LQTDARAPPVRPEDGAASVALSDLRPERRGEFLRLMHEAYGHAMSEQEFDWFFERNPAGGRVLSAAEEDGRVLGVLAMSVARAVVSGREERVAFAVHAVTHPDSRGKGIFSKLELRNEERVAVDGVSLALGFTNPQAGPILVGKLGWRDLYRMRFWARPLLPRAPRGTSTLARFDDRHETAWRSVAPRWGNCIVRDRAYLNWRYVEAPKDYRLFDSPNGYAVLGEGMRKGFRTAVICDLVAPPREARRLLRRCLRSAGRGARLAVGVPAPGQASAYLSLGFVPTPMKIRVIGKALRDDAVLPERWHFAPGDTDIF